MEQIKGRAIGFARDELSKLHDEQPAQVSALMNGEGEITRSTVAALRAASTSTGAPSAAVAKHSTSLIEQVSATCTRLELDGAGAQGMGERRAALARDLAQGARRAEELRRRAVALDHLLDLLKNKRGALTRKLQAPLQKHLNHYLQLLFRNSPTSTVIAPGFAARQHLT